MNTTSNSTIMSARENAQSDASLEAQRTVLDSQKESASSWFKNAYNKVSQFTRKAVDSVFGKKEEITAQTRSAKKSVGGIQGSLRAAVLAVTPMLVSCGDASLTSTTGQPTTTVETPAQQAPSTEQAAENADSWKDRLVMFYYDGKDWNFSGKWKKGGFMVKVEVDGKQVDEVYATPSEDGSFKVSGLAGESAKEMRIKAYEVGDTPEQDIQIPIEPDKNTAGMVGVPFVHNVDY